MELYINGILAEEGMEVTTNRGEKGILQGWKEPHKPSSTGKVYVKLPIRQYTSEYFPSVIGGKWKTSEDELYEKIGKEFQDYDFLAKPFGIPPEGWTVEVNETTDIEYMEIQLPDYEDGKTPNLSDIKQFTYLKKSQVSTYYVFTRKK